MSLSLAEEQVLIESARRGDEQAFERLIQAYSPSLYRVVMRMASDHQEAEAIVQEAFWRTWRSLGHYHNDRAFFPYLVTVAVNLQRDRWRSDRWLEERDLEIVAGDAIDPLPAPEKQLEEGEKSQFLADKIRNLPPAYRAVISLRYEAEMSYEEIALVLNLPVNTIRTHLYRAKQKLRQEMEGYNG